MLGPEARAAQEREWQAREKAERNALRARLAAAADMIFDKHDLDALVRVAERMAKEE